MVRQLGGNDRPGYPERRVRRVKSDDFPVTPGPREDQTVRPKTLTPGSFVGIRNKDSTMKASANEGI